jgi:hypothetical protein
MWGVAGHFTMSVLPVLYFGTLSAIFYVVLGIWDILKFIWNLFIVDSRV